MESTESNNVYLPTINTQPAQRKTQLPVEICTTWK